MNSWPDPAHKETHWLRTGDARRRLGCRGGNGGKRRSSSYSTDRFAADRRPARRGRGEADNIPTAWERNTTMGPQMNLMSSGTHRFRCFTPVETSSVWIALTDGQRTGSYLHGLVADSSWCVDAPIHFRAAPLQPDSQSILAGRVLCALPYRRLSYFLRSGPEDPCTYLTWQLRSCPGGSTVHLQLDRSECADTEEEAENTWLPVFAALQTLLSRDERSRC